MNTKLCYLGLAIAASMGIPGQANAQNWVVPNIVGGVVGGIVGGLVNQPPYYYYGPSYGPAYAPPAYGAVGYCSQRFRSYNPYTGLYIGYDGLYHSCP